MQEGVGTDVIVAYVKSRLAAALSAEEIVDWKKSGIAEPVIEAAIAQPSVALSERAFTPNLRGLPPR